MDAAYILDILKKLTAILAAISAFLGPASVPVAPLSPKIAPVSVLTVERAQSLGLLPQGPVFAPFKAGTGHFGAAGIVPKTAAFFETYITAPMATGDTSFNLAASSTTAGVPLQNGLYSFVLDQGNSSQEVVEGTLSGVSVTGVTRGIDPQNPNATTSVLIFAHGRGADVKITDYTFIGHLTNIFSGSDTLPSTLSYTGHPTCASSASTTLVDWYCVSQVATSGAVDAGIASKGLVAVNGWGTAATSSDGTQTLYGVPHFGLFASSSRVASLGIVTNTSGTLDSSFFSTSTNYGPFTGSWTYNGSSTFNATATFRGTADFSAGTILGIPNNQLIAASSTSFNTFSSVATTTLLSISIPANILKGNNAVRGTIKFSSVSWNLTNDWVKMNLTFGSNATSSVALSASASANGSKGSFDFLIVANAATSSQFGEMTFTTWAQGSAASSTAGSLTGGAVQNNFTSSQDGTVAQTLTISTTNSANSVNIGVISTSYLVEKIINQ